MGKRKNIILNILCLFISIILLIILAFSVTNIKFDYLIRSLNRERTIKFDNIHKTLPFGYFCDYIFDEDENKKYSCILSSIYGDVGYLIFYSDDSMAASNDSLKQDFIMRIKNKSTYGLMGYLDYYYCDDYEILLYSDIETNYNLIIYGYTALIPEKYAEISIVGPEINKKEFFKIVMLVLNGEKIIQLK